MFKNIINYFIHEYTFTWNERRPTDNLDNSSFGLLKKMIFTTNTTYYNIFNVYIIIIIYNVWPYGFIRRWTDVGTSRLCVYAVYRIKHKKKHIRLTRLLYVYDIIIYRERNLYSTMRISFFFLCCNTKIRRHLHLYLL